LSSGGNNNQQLQPEIFGISGKKALEYRDKKLHAGKVDIQRYV
jgi:hypothetical protein